MKHGTRAKLAATGPAALVAALALLSGCTMSPASGEDLARSQHDLVLALPGDTGGTGRGNRPPVVATDGLSDRLFFIRALGGRCWDFGAEALRQAGAPVYLYTCNGTSSQQVRVREIDASHDVELRVPLTNLCIGVRGGYISYGAPLELQVCGEGAPAQRFALDGDSVMVGVQREGRVSRELVIRPDLDRTVNRTPLVVGLRETSDAEYFRMRAVDGSAASPTSGFVRVARSHAPGLPADYWLEWASQRGWGTVIEIDDRETFVLTETRTIPDGVTLRGYRKRTDPGPVLSYRNQGRGDFAIWVTGDRARVTGLRFEGVDHLMGPPGLGPSWSPSGAVRVFADRGRRAFIDHIESTHWGLSSVDVVGDTGATSVCAPEGAYPRDPGARVLRNYIHENRRKGGYGISAGNGAFILAQGNVAFKNAHSITADPWALTGYLAYDNLLLAPSFDSPESSNQDLDVHGGHDCGSNGGCEGGISGDYFDVGWNTFLQTRHFNLNQRGTPCRFTLFHDNVGAQPLLLNDEGLRTSTTGLVLFQAPPPSGPGDRATYVWNNAFDQASLMADLGSADFDGDGLADTFATTGVTWWFTSNRTGEWRFLNRMPEQRSALYLADIDGDGLADVYTSRDGRVEVSWAGRSPWQALPPVGRQ